MTLVARQYYDICYNSLGQPYRCRSTWNSWGRWLALGLIVLGALILFFLCSCFSARKRRRAGRQPYYGTGWAGNTPFGHGQAQYNPNYQTQQAPPPPTYNQTQNYGGYYGGGENQGYFGGNRQADVEMTSPQNAYTNRGGDNVYSPPAGPPPNKV